MWNLTLNLEVPIVAIFTLLHPCLLTPAGVCEVSSELVTNILAQIRFD